MRWLLPEAVEDVLPDEARRLESLRRQLLDEFELHGFELVVPPMLEFLESLLTGSGGDLDLRTFKLMDQLSGRSIGIRADMTPQVARIDAHLLNREGVARLCYCGSVLHTLPAGLHGTREPIQIGAEIYGHEGLEADIEIIRLLAKSMQICGLSASRIDVGHVGLFSALAQHGKLHDQLALDLFTALQAKDIPELRQLTQQMSPDLQRAFLLLPDLYGDFDVLSRADVELDFDGSTGGAIAKALGELRRLGEALKDLPVSFDLADLRGYRYHNGVAFSAYAAGSATAIARGGRYDKVSQAYDRVRPATGFSMDLRELTRLAPAPASSGGILAPWPADDGVHAEVERLRDEGERVVIALPGHEGYWRDAGCDRRLVRDAGVWLIKKFEEV